MRKHLFWAVHFPQIFTTFLQLFGKMFEQEEILGLLEKCWAWTTILVELVFAQLDWRASPLFLANLLFSLFLFSSMSLLRISFLAEAMYTTACCYAPAPLETVFEQIGESLALGSVLIFGWSFGYREIVKLCN